MKIFYKSIILAAMAATFSGLCEAKPIQKATGDADQDGTFRSLFYTIEEFEAYTIINANEDDFTWTYNDDEATAYVRSNRDKVTPKDDWMITPDIELKAGNEYKLTLDIRARNSSKPETFEMKMGRGNTVEAMTTTIIPATDCVNPDSKRYIAFFTVEEDGIYNLGLHAISQPDMSYIYFDYIGVSSPMDVGAPLAVTDIAIVPDIDGAATAEISFTAPVKNVGGDDLTDNITIELLRDNELVHTFYDVAPGAVVNYTDDFYDYMEEERDPLGRHTWTFVSYNSYGVGKKDSKSGYIGINAPGPCPKVEAKETSDPGMVTITWEEPATDVDGNPVNKSKLLYDLYRIDAGKELIYENLQQLSFTYRAVAEDQQDFVKYAVVAKTEGGESSLTGCTMIPVGKPYSLPYQESVGESLSHVLATFGVVGNAGWSMVADGMFGINSSDGDNGFMAMTGEMPGDQAYLHLGKISLEGAQHPVISFDVYNNAADNANEVAVCVMQGGHLSWIEGRILNQVAGEGKWCRVAFDLSDWAGQVVELGVASTIYSYTATAIDALVVEEGVEKNLAITLDALPESIESNTDFNLAVRVVNLGYGDAEGYAVSLYRDGEFVAEESGLQLLYTGDSLTVVFTEKLNPTYGLNYTYSAEVKYEGDAVESNNKIEDIELSIKGSDLPTVANLQASAQGGAVVLTWEAPQDATEIPVGYNVYRGHDLLTSEPVGLLTYTDEQIGQDINYYVTACYSESRESAPVGIRISSVSSLLSEKAGVRVAGDCLVIFGPNAAAVTVSDTQGRVLFNNSDATLPVSISVAPGIYIVKAAGRSYSVVVR